MNARTRLASLLISVGIAVGVAAACAPRTVTMQVTPPLNAPVDPSADPVAEQPSTDPAVDPSADPLAEASTMPLEEPAEELDADRQVAIPASSPVQDPAVSPAAAPASTAAQQSRSPGAAVGPLRPTVPATFYVGNTLGRGMTIRSGPASVDLIRAWPEGTLLIGLGGERDAFGWTWAQVSDPDGNIGWMPTTYLLRSAPPTTDSGDSPAGSTPVPVPGTGTPSPASLPRLEVQGL